MAGGYRLEGEIHKLLVYVSGVSRQIRNEVEAKRRNEQAL
jgi:hypothetical protein